ncbi:AAA family ATPase [Cohnella sp. GCM10027633]|uniref:AAA family ATPase n=1 Tax=unclassified Cohnella TaxID=2636738 RepID=UPI00363996A0
MKFIIIFGPQAVGKMTVGQSLAEKLNIKLFHNHMSIDFVSQFFDYGSPSGKRLVGLIRQEIFEEVSASELEGLVFTFVWGFDLPSDWEYIERISHLFESRGAEVYFVELEAEYGERLRRNRTDNRLLHKPTKRDVERSERDLISTNERHRLNSFPGEITKKNYIRINNTNIQPEEVANMIMNQFGIID